MELIVTTDKIWLNTMAIHLTFCEDYEYVLGKPLILNTTLIFGQTTLD